MYYVLLWLALWGCGRRASVVQAQRQIHRAPLGRPRRRRSFVAQSLVRPELIVETEPLADADAPHVTIGIGLQVHFFVLQAAPQPDQWL